MSDVTPIGRPSARTVGQPGRLTRPDIEKMVGKPTRGKDKVELSTAAQLLSKLAELPDVRKDLVERVRGEIATGNYDTPDKIDTLIDRLIDDLA